MVKPIYIIIAVIIVIGIIGAIYLVTSNASTPTVANGDTIEVFYNGTLTNGTQFDTNIGGQPLGFTVGSGQVIEGFDSGVIGMKLNETKTITIPENEAYGPVNPSLIVTVPISAFGNQSVHVGMTVTEDSSGQEMQGVVKEITATNATVDFNLPSSWPDIDIQDNRGKNRERVRNTFLEIN